MKEPSREAVASRRPDTPEMHDTTSAHAAGAGDSGRKRTLIAVLGGVLLLGLVIAVIVATTLTRKPSEAAPPVVASVSASATPTPAPAPTTGSATPAVSATGSQSPHPTVTPVAVPKVGDCVKPVPQKSGGPKYEKTSCDASGAFVFQVAKFGTGAVDCPQSDSRPYSITMLRGKGGEPAGYICLAMKLHQDKCYSFASGNAEVPCGDAAAQVKVTKVLQSGDASQCKPKGIGYPELKVAYCLDDVKNG